MSHRISAMLRGSKNMERIPTPNKRRDRTELGIHPAEPRQTVQVRFADGKTFEGPVGTSLAEFVDSAYPASESPIAATLVNGRRDELTYQVTQDVKGQTIDTHTGDGIRIYQRSVSFLLVVAIRELFP